MARKIDYRSIEIPDDKQPADYTYAERRAEILRLVERAGHPRLLNQSDLARRYGCTRPNIHNDLDVLAEYIDDVLGKRRVLNTHTVIHRCITSLLENEEYRKAARTQLDLNEWIDEYHDKAAIAERLDEIEVKLEQRDADSPPRPSITADGGIDFDTEANDE